MKHNLKTFPLDCERWNDIPSEYRDRIRQWYRDFEAELQEKFVSFSDVMASCRNDFCDEDFYRKTLEWLNKFEEEILGDGA